MSGAVSTPTSLNSPAFVQVVRKDARDDDGFTMTLPNGISFRNIGEDQIGLVAQLVHQL